MSEQRIDACGNSMESPQHHTDPSKAHHLRATLSEQVCHRLAAGARQLEINVCGESATVSLTGVVHSFYTKQVLYQLCRRFTPGFRVIDTTVVGPSAAL